MVVSCLSSSRYCLSGRAPFFFWHKGAVFPLIPRWNPADHNGNGTIKHIFSNSVGFLITLVPSHLSDFTFGRLLWCFASLIQPKLSARPTDCCCVYQSAFVFVTVFHHKKIVKPHNSVGGTKDHIACEMPLIVFLHTLTLSASRFSKPPLGVCTPTREIVHIWLINTTHHRSSSPHHHLPHLPPSLSVHLLPLRLFYAQNKSERAHARTHG